MTRDGTIRELRELRTAWFDRVLRKNAPQREVLSDEEEADRSKANDDLWLEYDRQTELLVLWALKRGVEATEEWPNGHGTPEYDVQPVMGCQLVRPNIKWDTPNQDENPAPTSEVAQNKMTPDQPRANNA
jgi:hypothetical protein